MSDLLSRAIQIKSETTSKANTANRVGSLFQDIVIDLETITGSTITSLSTAIANISEFDPSSLETQIINETSVRASVDSTLSTVIENITEFDPSSLETQIINETSVRASVDSALSVIISNSSFDPSSLETQISTRIVVDSNLSTALSSEINTRLTADSTETSVRASVDSALSVIISNSSFDPSSLESEISTEISDRISGDTSLENEIISSKINAENGLYLSGNTIKMGGDLNEDTNINLLNNNLNIKVGDLFDSGNGFLFTVSAMCVQNDGKFLIGGEFLSYNGNSNYKRLIRINPDGSIDETFIVNVDNISEVTKLLIDNDSILACGRFNFDSGTVRTIVRYDLNGNIEQVFGNFDSTVYSFDLLDDNKILVGGKFSEYSGITAESIVRLNPDGSIDETFLNVTNRPNTYKLLTQNDGKILVGGWFESYLGVNSTGIIRLNSDGSVDNTFETGGGFDKITINPTVNEIFIQDDDKILIGGKFSEYSGITISNNIIRLNPDGSLDTSFNAGLGVTDGVYNNPVGTIFVQDDNKILIGGGFTEYNNITTNRIIRLNPDGSIDDTFNVGTGFNGTVVKIYINDEKIITIGGFSTYNNITAKGIAVLNTNGYIIQNENILSFKYNEIEVFSNLILKNGRSLIIKETPKQLYDTTQLLVRDTLTGEIKSNDTIIQNMAQFISGSTNGLTTINNIVKLGGELNETTEISQNNNLFTISNLIRNFIVEIDNISNVFYNNDNIFLITYNTDNSNKNIVKLNPDGSVDETFNTGNGFNNDIELILFQNDGKLLVTGYFNEFNNEESNLLIRLNTDGTKDNSFVVGNFNPVSEIVNIFSIGYQNDGKILVNGYFNAYSGITTTNFIRLNSDGTLDTSFNSGGTGLNFQEIGFGVISNILFKDDKILIFGLFDKYNNNDVNGFVSLNLDGSLDTTFSEFTPSIESSEDRNIYVTTYYNNDKILVGGQFTEYSGVTANGIIRLNLDGSIDDTFNTGTGFDSTVFLINIQNDGKILVVGEFTEYSGVTANGIIRLNSDGSIDDTFNIGTGFNNNIEKMYIDNEEIIIYGYFTEYNGNLVNNVIKLDLNGNIVPSHTYLSVLESSGKTITIGDSGNDIVIDSELDIDDNNSPILVRDLITGKLKQKQITNILDITYDELVTKIQAEELYPGHLYRITDFATTHYILNNEGYICLDGDLNPVINTGSLEPLIVLAINSNTISQEAKSELYPQDLIHYDWNPDNWKFDIAFSAWDEEVLPGFKGVIYFRHDTFNDVLMGHDFRHVLNRRWKRNDPIYDPGETYTKGVKVQAPLDGVYISLKDANSGNLLSDEAWWVKIISYDITEYIAQSISIAQDPTDFIDVPCFYSQEADPEDQYNREVRSVHLEPFKDDNINQFQSFSILPNNVFILIPEIQEFQVIGIYAKPLCGNNTFLGLQRGNTLEENFANNTIDLLFYGNTIGSEFNSNTIGINFNNNTIGSFYTNNTIGPIFYNNTIGPIFHYNTIGSGFYNNTIGSEFNSNTIGINFTDNTIGPGFNSNTIGINFYSNTIGPGFISNIIDSQFTNNTVGANFSRNTIDSEFMNNTVGPDIYGNTIGSGFYNNTIGSEFTNNTTGTNFSSNEIGNGVTYCNFNDYFQGNTVGNKVSYINTHGTLATPFRNNEFKNGVSGTSALSKLDFSGGTHISASYNCEIYKRPDGVIRLKYIDNTDTLVITDHNA